MYKVLVVFAREYQTQVKSKAFVISLVLMPVLMTGSIVVQTLLKDQVDVQDRKIAVLDRSGMIFDKLAELAEQRNTSGILDHEGKQVRPRFVLEGVKPNPDLAQQRLALSDRVRKNALAAFVEVGPEIFEGTGEGEDGQVLYYSNRVIDQEFPRWLALPLNQIVQTYRFAKANLPQEAVMRATRPVSLQTLGLVSRGESGQIKEASRADSAVNFMVPFGMMMLIFMGVMVGATPLLQAIIEEKMQRIAEVLLGSLSPFQLMLGKLLGVVAVSLTMISIYLAGAYALAIYFERAELIELSQIGWLLAYTVLAVLMFGSMFCAIGASCSEIKDAQSLMTPVMILVVLPMFFLSTVMQSPSGTLATALSFIPPATPMFMIVRMGIPPGIPMWQPVVGLLDVLAFTALCVFLASRIFRIGILMQGKPPRLSDLVRWALHG